MTPLFKSLVVSRATPSISTRSLKSLPHIAAFRAESQALVNMARSGVRLGHFELDLSIPALSGPVARPLDEEFPHPRPASLRRHPDVVNETLRLGRHEPTFAEDQIPEELVVRGLGDPPFRSPPCRARSSSGNGLPTCRDPTARVRPPGCRPIRSAGLLATSRRRPRVEPVACGRPRSDPFRDTASRRMKMSARSFPIGLRRNKIRVVVTHCPAFI